VQITMLGLLAVALELRRGKSVLISRTSSW